MGMHIAVAKEVVAKEERINGYGVCAFTKSGKCYAPGRNCKYCLSYNLEANKGRTERLMSTNINDIDENF